MKNNPETWPFVQTTACSNCTVSVLFITKCNHLSHKSLFVQLLIVPLLTKGKKTKGMFDSFHWYLSRLCNNLSIKCLDLLLYLESIPKYSIQQYTIIPKFKINSMLDNSLGISTKWKHRLASWLLEIKITCKLQHLVVWITFKSWYYGVILYISLDSLFT